MLNSIRPAVQKTKKFVKEYQTLTACAATAVVTAYIVHDREISEFKHVAALAARMTLKEDERLAMLLDTTSFIDGKGLTEEFYAFAPRRNRD